jgi:hypothetical protein
MSDLPDINNISGALAGAFLFVALGMQFFGFFVIEPAWIGNIVGWASMFFYLNAALYYLRYAYGGKDAWRNAALIFLAGLFICTICYFYNPALRPSVKSFFDRIGVNLASGYVPRRHRGR